MASTPLPQLPASHADLVKYVSKHPDAPLTELIEPYRKYEAHLRRMFAQEPDAEPLKDPHVNVLPLFNQDTPSITVRARDPSSESEEEKARYIMPLPDNMRRPSGSPAVVQSLKEFKRNFNVFSESSLIELDWANVVASGSSVVNCLLPVPKKYSATKRGLREFYHEKFSPASDVDLFLYGLTEEEAVEKIKEIETKVRDALLTETTTVRTKHAITICSQYPTRHIQIVLRIYKSVSEILTGFDIDCSGAAYDGNQVYVTPRALQSYMTQINHIDLSRRSPSYENRLSKYSHRGFEVYWPELDRSRIDPTIFERSFQRTLGLARLLVLEQLPTAQARDTYLDKRREERGRPRIDRFRRNLHSLKGDIKGQHEDEVADWVDEQEVSNYHTFTIPYGPKFHAKKIEKLCYTRDLLLNAEWNQPEERKVYLHRHPAFFGRFEDVAADCCGYCPVPVTEEEKEIAEEESKIYVSGKISFIKDDPGRQQIGSFNPLTDDDWTEMAYVGNTARLCQAIVDKDAEHVQDWLAQEGADPNTRDYTGRTPLHLAAMCSTPEIVKLLVDAGARLIARVADGRTALHLAAARGDLEIVKILMERSISNEAEHEEKFDKLRQPQKDDGSEVDNKSNRSEDEDEENDDSDMDLLDEDDYESGESDEEGRSTTSRSFVKIKAKEQAEAAKKEELVPQEDQDEPDFYDINAIAWDTPCSALHFAIMEGHEDVVRALCQEYGADILMPVKFLDASMKPAALLTLVLATALPVEKAKSMARTLLSLGATSSQADMNGVTAFHRLVEQNAESLLDLLFELDKTGSKTAINHIAFTGYDRSETPLQVAVREGNLGLVLKLLENGAIAEVDFETWLKSAKQSQMQDRLGTFEENQKKFKVQMEHPLILAILSKTPATALELLNKGCDPNPLCAATQSMLQDTYRNQWKGYSALDLVNRQLKALRGYNGEVANGGHLSSGCARFACSCRRRGGAQASKETLPAGIDTYLDSYKEGTYQHWIISRDIQSRKDRYHQHLKQYEESQAALTNMSGAAEKAAAIKEAIETLEKIEKVMRAKGAKTFAELYPDRKEDGNYDDSDRHRSLVDVPNDSVYDYTFNWGNVSDITEARNAAYVELFDAAWCGDLEKIKTLTLTSWDEAKSEAPLKIAVDDQHHNNPFSLAFLRGHYAVAKGILEIALAQYSPEQEPKMRYKMSVGREDEEYSEDEDSVMSDAEGLAVYGEIVDDQFTIDNIGEVSMQVNSKTKPLEMMDWVCAPAHLDDKGALDFSPLVHVTRNKNMEGLKFLLDMGEQFSAQSADSDSITSQLGTLPNAFSTAIIQGHIEVLTELIKRTGAGLPLDNLIKDSGVEVKEKPRYYQGLSVYGKKRQDWATAGRDSVTRTPTGTQMSPLLTAARAACIESVEWFLTDIPLRLYQEFVKSKAAREDPRLKHLNQAPEGLEKAIAKWLNNHNDLIIHQAVFAKPSTKANDLVSYLVKTCPSAIEARTAATNMTPLLHACMLGRVEIAKILLDAGADQTAKAQNWDNALHVALSLAPTADKLKPLLDLFDRDVLARLLRERNSLSHQAGRTPLHSWLATVVDGRYYGGDISEALRVLDLLVGISPEKTATQRALHMLDGAGDTPLHFLIARCANPVAADVPRLVRAVLDLDPAAGLLLRENAVGRTPFEVAHDNFFAGKVKAPEAGGGRRRYYYSYWYGTDDRSETTKLVCREPKAFLEGEKEKGHEDDSRAAQVWRLCCEHTEQCAASTQPLRRRLVSLHEANDVAKRLGDQQFKQRYGYTLKQPEDGSDDKSDDQDADKEYRDGYGNRRSYRNRYGFGDAETDPNQFSVAPWNSQYHHVWKTSKEFEEEDEAAKKST